MGIDPSFWVALTALSASIIFGVIGALRNNNVDVKSEIDEAKKEASTDTKIADNTAQLTETQEAIADIYARLDAIDEQLAAKIEKEVTA